MTQNNQIEIKSISKAKKHYTYEIETTIEKIKVTEDIIVQFNLYKGKIITIEEYDEIKRGIKKEEIFLKVLNYISYQMRSKSEIKSYLKDLECKDTDSSSIISRLEKVGYIDDELLAKNILDSIISHLKGPKCYQEKLFIRKVTSRIDYSNDIEKEVLLQAIEKYKNKKEGLPKKKQKEVLFNKLLRDGFTSSLVISYINKLDFIDNSVEKIDKEICRLKLKYQKYQGYELKNKLINSLLSLGYEYSTIIKYIDVNNLDE